MHMTARDSLAWPVPCPVKNSFGFAFLRELGQVPTQILRGVRGAEAEAPLSKEARV